MTCIFRQDLQDSFKINKICPVNREESCKSCLMTLWLEGEF